MPSFEPVTAVLRAFDVLLTVNRLKEASVGDIFRETGLNRPTIVRMLETLIHAGFVSRHPTQAVYFPTGRTLDLSSGYKKHEEMAIVAAPILVGLHKELQWPSDVAVFDRDAMVVARTSRGEGFLHFDRRAGYRRHRSRIGLPLGYEPPFQFQPPVGCCANSRATSTQWRAARKPAILATACGQRPNHRPKRCSPAWSSGCHMPGFD